MCDCLDKLTGEMGWAFPFYKPLSYNKNGELKAHDWAVQLHKSTNSGKRAKESIFLFLSYCPVCGDTHAPESPSNCPLRTDPDCGTSEHDRISG